jgi:hypothetical protein
MKKIHVLVLLAVIGLGFAGAVKAATTSCCPSPECCSHCSGSCKK